jgi:hypothetical protein
MSNPFTASKGYICYIDESGDEGFKFGEGSSDWFVLAAVVCRRRDDGSLSALVDEIKKEIAWPPAKQLHWKKLHHMEKKFYAARLLELNLRFVCVAVYKPQLIERENFQVRYRLYYYTTRYLLERVTWLIRQAQKHQAEGDGKVGMAFSNRAGMSYKELRGYLDKLKKKSETGQDVRIEWDHLGIADVKAVPPGRLPGLQIADAVAGIFYNALETSKTKGQATEYAEIIIPKLFTYKGKNLGYGFKVLPREAVAVLQNKPELEWYKKLR